jgi:hypothetical protein
MGYGTILWSGDHVLALIAEDLEGFVEDRSKLGEDRAATNATTFVMLELRLRNTHAVHFPIDGCSQHEFLGHNRYFKLVLTLFQHIEACVFDKIDFNWGGFWKR